MQRIARRVEVGLEQVLRAWPEKEEAMAEDMLEGICR
jgi:hypothetical protein